MSGRKQKLLCRELKGHNSACQERWSEDRVWMSHPEDTFFSARMLTVAPHWSLSRAFPTQARNYAGVLAEDGVFSCKFFFRIVSPLDAIRKLDIAEENGHRQRGKRCARRRTFSSIFRHSAAKGNPFPKSRSRRNGYGAMNSGAFEIDRCFAPGPSKVTQKRLSRWRERERVSETRRKRYFRSGTWLLFALTSTSRDRREMQDLLWTGW